MRGADSLAGKGGGEEAPGADLATDESETRGFPPDMVLSAGMGGGAPPPVEGSGGGLEGPSGTGVLSAIFLSAWINA
jgi:hypothetical protein